MKSLPLQLKKINALTRSVSLFFAALSLSTIAFCADFDTERSLGIKVKEIDGKVVVTEVNVGHKTSLQAHDVIVGVEMTKISNIEDYKKLTTSLSSKEYLYFRVTRGVEDKVCVTKNMALFGADDQSNYSIEKTDSLITTKNKDQSIGTAKAKCEEMGFKQGTTDFSNCVLKIYSIEAEGSKNRIESLPYQTQTNDEQTRLLREQNERAKAEAARRYLEWANNPKTWGNPTNVRIVP